MVGCVCGESQAVENRKVLIKTGRDHSIEILGNSFVAPSGNHDGFCIFLFGPPNIPQSSLLVDRRELENRIASRQGLVDCLEGVGLALNVLLVLRIQVDLQTPKR